VSGTVCSQTLSQLGKATTTGAQAMFRQKGAVLEIDRFLPIVDVEQTAFLFHIWKVPSSNSATSHPNFEDFYSLIQSPEVNIGIIPQFGPRPRPYNSSFDATYSEQLSKSLNTLRSEGCAG
jgi:hypothetical protein